MAEVVGLRELRQHASEVVRRVEAGEQLTVTVNGRAAARIVPVGRARWRPVAELTELFRGPAEDVAEWQRDRALIDQSVQRPPLL